MNLRPYQQKFIDDIQAEWDNGVQRVCGVKSYQEILQVAQFMGYKKGRAWHKWQEIKIPGVDFMALKIFQLKKAVILDSSP